MHQPQTEATSASDEADALMLTQENQCIGALQPTTSIQLNNNLTESETTKQDMEQQADYDEEAIMPTQNENIELIQ